MYPATAKLSVEADQESETVEVVFPVGVRFCGTVGGWVSWAFVTVRTSVALPVPALFVAVIVTFEVPADAGVPEMRPVAVFTERPDGKPAAPKLVGLFDAVIVYENGLPAVAEAERALVITGWITLFTVTVTVAAVAWLPAASAATAVSACEPFVEPRLFQKTWYGALVTGAPRFAPSSLNWTDATPTLSEAVAETVTEPETVALSAGAVSETVGGVVSDWACVAAFTETDWAETLPAAS